VLFYVLFCVDCVVLCTVCVSMCTVLLPPGVYPIAVKYIISYHINYRSGRFHAFRLWLSLNNLKIIRAYFVISEMWCWRSVEKTVGPILWEMEVFQRVRVESNRLQKMKTSNANWICHILRRTCLIKHVIQWKIQETIDVKGRRGIRRKQLLDNL